MSHKRSKEEKPVGKNFSPKETRNMKQENKKCEGGGFKMTPQRQLPSLGYRTDNRYLLLCVYYKQISFIYNYRRGPMISCRNWQIEIPT